mmetsp:Transcript_84410/g.234013  ORF Transcript_84410/g.234013 Transcript_84410/m.234013 type:complete len:210 (+) Transcript_84410:422-1051(+)
MWRCKHPTLTTRQSGSPRVGHPCTPGAPPGRAPGCRGPSASAARGKTCPRPCRAPRSRESAAGCRRTRGCKHSTRPSRRRSNPQTRCKARRHCSWHRPALHHWLVARNGLPQRRLGASATSGRPRNCWSTSPSRPSHPTGRSRKSRRCTFACCTHRPPPCSAAHMASRPAPTASRWSASASSDPRHRESCSRSTRSNGPTSNPRIHKGR